MPAAILDEEEGTRRAAVRAATHDRVDLHLRAGGAGITHTLPMVAGLDRAGVEAEVGPGETLLRSGDRVRIVLCGATSGSGPAMDLQRLFIRQIQVIGSTLANPGELAERLAFIDRTGLRPVIDRRFALAETPAALDHLDAGNQFGKVAITVSE